MRNELNKHKRSDSVKWIAITLAVIMLATGVLAVLTKGFRNWKPSEWFPKDPPIESILPPITDGDGNDLTEGAHALPRNMIFAPRAIDQPTEATLTATITPVEAENKKVDWTATFANASSTWATGKAVTDYLTITPTADGSLTAKVVCKAPFGEVINITVTSRDNPNAKDSCKVDYMKRLTGLKLEVIQDQSSGNAEIFADVDTTFDGVVADGGKTTISSNIPYFFSVIAIEGDGTISEKYTMSVNMKASQFFGKGMASVFTNPMVSGVNKEMLGGLHLFNPTFFETFVKLATTAERKNAIKKLCRHGLQLNSQNSVIFDVEVSSVGTYSQMTINCGLNIDATWSTGVEGVQLGDETLIF